jgi:nucleotide-binding universal stress UspA family protein
MNLSRILCAHDDSDVSRSVLAFALALAKWEDAQVHVVHLADPTLEPGGLAPFVVPPHRATTVVVREGDPVRTIADHACRERADLVIVGASLAAPGLDDVGRLAEDIARQVHCPTLIVPLAAPQRREELPFRNILCPIDFSPGSILAYEQALRLTQLAGGTLTLLHVVDEFRDRQSNPGFLQPVERQLRMAEARARLRLAISEESLNWCHVGVHVTAGASDVHIVAEAGRLGVDLMVMSLTPRVDTSAASVGSMVSRVAARVACPVLVIPGTSGSRGWDETFDASRRRDLRSREELSWVPVARVGSGHRRPA